MDSAMPAGAGTALAARDPRTARVVGCAYVRLPMMACVRTGCEDALRARRSGGKDLWWSAHAWPKRVRARRRFPSRRRILHPLPFGPHAKRIATSSIHPLKRNAICLVLGYDRIKYKFDHLFWGYQAHDDTTQQREEGRRRPFARVRAFLRRKRAVVGEGENDDDHRHAHLFFSFFHRILQCRSTVIRKGIITRHTRTHTRRH